MNKQLRTVKKLFSWVLVVSIALSLFPGVTIFANDDAESSDEVITIPSDSHSSIESGIDEMPVPEDLQGSQDNVEMSLDDNLPDEEADIAPGSDISDSNTDLSGIEEPGRLSDADGLETINDNEGDSSEEDADGIDADASADPSAALRVGEDEVLLAQDLQNDGGDDNAEAGDNDPVQNYWDLSIKFFDSTVDGGNTPLDSIDWDATTSELGRLQARTVEVQITYRNTSSEKDYAPGDLSLTIPNLMAGQGSQGSSSAFASNSSRLNWSVIIPANDSTHSGFDWTFSGSKNDANYVFTNAASFEENQNFEGTITLTYTLTPMGEFGVGGSDNTYPIEEVNVESCTHSMSSTLRAELKETSGEQAVIAESDQLKFDYTRTYTHPWQRREYSLRKTASRVSTLEGFGENPDDYIWVKYEFAPSPFRFRANLSSRWISIIDRHAVATNVGNIPTWASDYPYLDAFDGFIVDTFPEDVIVQTEDHNTPPLYKIQQGDGITYRFNPTGNTESSQRFVAYVGYPKDKYNEENGNLHITNTAELHGTYIEKTEEELLATADVSLDLSDFAFVYQGDLFRVDKYVYMYSNSQYYHYGHSYTNAYLGNMRYQDIQNDLSANTATWYLRPTIRYPGYKFDMVIGDDFLYSTDLNGTVSRVPDSDYYYTKIQYSPNSIHNTSGVVIKTNQYDCELWVRRSGNDEYECIERFRNGLKTSWTFTASDEVVAFYFVVKDCNEGFTPATGDAISCTTKFLRKDIPESGYLHNFDYLEIWRNIDGERVLMNEPGLDSYATDYTQQEIAAYDLENYGHYLQRGTDRVRWIFYNVPQLTEYLTSYKGQLGALVQEAENERFTGTFMISGGYGTHHAIQPNYKDDYKTEAHYKNLIYNIRFYDLLPQGMELLSTDAEIKDTLRLIIQDYNPYYGSIITDSRDYVESGLEDYFYTTHLSARFYDRDINRIPALEFEEYCRDHSTVTVERNWNGTGRTKITVDVDLSERPVFVSNNYESNAAPYARVEWSPLAVDYKFAIPYTSLQDYGGNYLNYVYSDPTVNNCSINFSAVDALDLDEDGSTTDRMSRSQASVDIQFDSASLQGLTKTVETSDTAFTAKQAISKLDSDYRYRIRIATGHSKVTNLVIYDIIEGNTYFPDNSFGPASAGEESWKGYFSGCDTSFAENQGWKVETYYSTEEAPGAYPQDESWRPLTDDVDKSTVRALAFVFLGEDGSPAVFGQNYSTFVEINMHSPKPEDHIDTTKLAYNGSWARWNALDEQDQIIPFIEGVQSNIVKIALNEKTEITVTKKWLYDSEDIRPESVHVILYANGEPVQEADLTSEGGWEHTFSDLWKFSDDGTKIAYTVEETNVPEGYEVIYSDGFVLHESAVPKDGNYIIKNIYAKTILRGTKTWKGDLEEDRPESLVVKLMRDGEEVARTTTDASLDWKYEFVADRWDENGNEIVYEVSEEVPDGYISHCSGKTGPVTIKFNSSSRTEGVNQDYLMIYYVLDGELYQTGRMGGSSFPSEINLPSSELFFYWHTDSSSTYYGFKVDSIEPYEGSEYRSATKVAGLPDYAVENVTQYPQTPHSYRNNSNNIWHYTPDAVFAIENESGMVRLEGIKTWSGDEPEDRPESITVYLLQNGTRVMSTTATAETDWSYSFKAEKYDSDGNEYTYTVEEEAPRGYIPTYQMGFNGPITVQLNSASRSESGCDYLYIYYKLNDRYYRVGYSGTSFPSSVNLPTSDVWFYWHTDGSVNNYYGFKIDSINSYNGSSFVSGSTYSLPNYPVTEIKPNELPESAHTPYPNSQNLVWHLNSSSFMINNDYTLTSVSGTKNWVGDVEEERPESVKIILLRNGEAYEEKIVTEEDNWSYRFGGLPRYDGNGTAYEYSVSEEVPRFYKATYSNGNEESNDPKAGYYNVTNTSTLITLTGIKQWTDDVPEQRPEAVKFNLMQNGIFYKQTTATAENNWRFSFTAEQYDTDGNEYIYSVTEEDTGRYIPSYSDGIEGPVTIKLDSRSRSESTSYDYLIIYYRLNDRLYATNRYGGSSFPASINIPSSDIYFYWHTDGSVSSYYGYKVTSIEPYTGTSYASASTVNALPGYEVKESADYPESAHNPYLNGTNEITHFITGDFIVTNEYAFRDIEVIKQWVNDVEGDRPESITVELLRNNEAFMSATLSEESGWRHTFEDLPKYDKNNELYHYSVAESQVPQFYKVSYTDGSDVSNDPTEEYFQIINTSLLTEITGSKQWVGDIEEERPQSITIDLLRNGELIDSKTVTAEDGWEYTFSRLPKENENGEEYIYTVAEHEVPAHYTVEYTDGSETSGTPAEGLYNIVNRSTLKVFSGIKVWREDTESERPDSIEVDVYRNDELFKTIVVRASEGWKFSFSAEQYDDDGNPYVFRVEEKTAVEDYITTVKEGRGNNGVTVKFNPESMTEEGYDYLTIFYYIGNTLYSTGRYTGTFPAEINLPTSDIYFYWHTDGSVSDYYGYKVDEIVDYSGTDFAYSYVYDYAFPGYTPIESSELPETNHYPYYDDNDLMLHYISPDFTVTNEYTKLSLDVNKVWAGDSEDDRPEQVEIELLRNGEQIETVTVSEQDGWKHHFSGLLKYDENGDEYRYSVREKTELEHYKVTYSNGTEDSDIPAAGYYTVINTSTLITLTGHKYWVGDSAETRPSKVTIELYRDGKLFMTTTTDEEHDWFYSFRAEQYDENGREYDYEIKESVPNGYEVSYFSSGPVTVKLNSQSRTEDQMYGDMLYIVYQLEGEVYGIGPFSGTNFPDEVNVPTNDLYFYWHTNDADNDYYGFKVDAILPYYGDSFNEAFQAGSMPPGEVVESAKLPESQHGNYAPGEDIVWHYSSGSSGLGITDIINTYTGLTDLTIKKTVDKYNSTSPAMFVFEVEGKIRDEVVYSEIGTITISDVGTQDCTFTSIPIGAEVTVTEIYSGATYTASGDISKTIVMEAEKDGVNRNIVEFTNTYNDEGGGGYGARNMFGRAEDGTWSWESDSVSEETGR